MAILVAKNAVTRSRTGK